MRAYAQLKERFRRIHALSGASAILGWDMATMMPKGGADTRSEQLEVLSVLAHNLLTAPEVGDALKAAKEEVLDDPWDRANLNEMERAWIHATCVDERLVGALSQASSRCEMRWRTARAENDFTGLQPLLQEVLDLTREVAERRAEVLGTTRYEALIDAFEPGARETEIDALFEALAAWIPETLAKVMDRQGRSGPIVRPSGPFPTEQQTDLCRTLLGVVGFDFQHGRLDTSHHPFCGGVPEDVRITTRYREDDFVQSLMGVLHECGHALYERGLPPAWRNQPVGTSRGMVLHESQSLLIEMQVCRSRPFLEWVAPLVRDAFGGEGPGWEAESLRRIYQRVEPGLIRVDADEVTYPAHVILRTRLEKAMIEGDLLLADLPGAWSDGLHALLGIRPVDDRDGCLQDIHWPSGLWGYFPTYTLGALAAAQLFQAAVRADSSIPGDLAQGDFRSLLGWLRPNVHERASSASTQTILMEATGEKLGPAPYQAHILQRYLGE
jgi:carboxypeptidase Taq